MPFEKPFDAAITRYYEDEVPAKIRKAIEKAGKNDILDPSYAYDERMDKGDYEDTLEALQIELMKMQQWVIDSGTRVVVLFEGRDAAGKGGAIKRLTLNLNPRNATVVALSKPNERERGEWYFQRYINHLPTEGELALFDRSWYNRAVVEPVMGFCSKEETAAFLRQTPAFEDMLIDDGIILIKFWLSVSRAEQLRRFLARESDPLKHWKLSPVDIAALPKWDAYTEAKQHMFRHTHTAIAPWTIIRAEDKRRARLAVIRSVLSRLDYPDRDTKLAGPPDPLICGGPETMGDLA